VRRQPRKRVQPSVLLAVAVATGFAEAAKVAAGYESGGLYRRAAWLLIVGLLTILVFGLPLVAARKKIDQKLPG
jgi:predicted acyltransferase